MPDGKDDQPAEVRGAATATAASCAAGRAPTTGSSRSAGSASATWPPPGRFRASAKRVGEAASCFGVPQSGKGYEPMSMTDPIADLLTRIRNAVSVRQRQVDAPASMVKSRILEVLKREGYIEDFKVVEQGRRKMIRVYLKYSSDRRAGHHRDPPREQARPARLPRRDRARAGPPRHRHRRALDAARGPQRPGMPQGARRRGNPLHPLVSGLELE